MRESALWATLAIGLSLSGRARANWLIRAYADPRIEIANLSQAELLIQGTYLEPGYPVFMSHAGGLNFSDNGATGGPFGLGTQVAGLPPGENHYFAVQALGSVTAQTTGRYIFETQADETARLRVGVNGAPKSILIFGSVVSSGNPTTGSGAINLAAGQRLDFEWTWFNRSGPGFGKIYYRRDGDASGALLGDPSFGLSPVTPSFDVKVYQAELPSIMTSFGEADALRTRRANRQGTASRNTFNLSQNGPLGDFFLNDPIPWPPPPWARPDFAVEGLGVLVISPEQAGNYVFRSFTQGAGRLRIDIDQDGFEPTDTLVQSPESTGPHKLDSAPVSLAAGYYPIEYLWFSRETSAHAEISARPADDSTFALLGMTLDVIQPLAADANFDFIVNDADLAILQQHFGQPGGLFQGDFNSDGFINFADFQILERNFGLSQPIPTSVPEPAALGLVVILVSFLRARR